MRIVLTGGGTGGHLVPFEPIIEALRTVYLEQRGTLPQRIDPDQLELIFVGVADQPTRDFFSHFDVASIHIPAGKFRRYASVRQVFDLLILLPLGLIKALLVGWRIMPDVIVSKGGYGSLPLLLAAICYRIPILLHESDAVLGLANAWTTRFAAALTVGFTATYDSVPRYQYKTFVTGTPVRARFGQVTAASARRTFNLATGDTVVLVMGGSQGAQAINEVLLQVLPELVLEAAVIHLTGTRHYTQIATVASELLEASSRKSRYLVYPYLDETVVEAMTAADVVVSRAGATTLAELTRLRKPALLIPLPSAAGDHQWRNAQAYEKWGAARVLDQSNLGKNLFLRSLRDLLTDTKLRQELTNNMAELDHPNAARDIALLAFKLATGLKPKREAK